MNKRIQKYKKIINLFSKKDIDQFLHDISLKQCINTFEINENIINQSLDPALNTNKKKNIIKKTATNASIHTATLQILSIINSFRDMDYLVSICRLLSQEINLKNDRITEIDDNLNCGTILYKDGKKITASMGEYMNQLRLYILKQFEGEERYDK